MASMSLRGSDIQETTVNTDSLTQSQEQIMTGGGIVLQPQNLQLPSRESVREQVGPDRNVIRDVSLSKGSRYSITERRVPELIPVLGSQLAGDVSQGAITFRRARSYPRNL